MKLLMQTGVLQGNSLDITLTAIWMDGRKHATEEFALHGADTTPIEEWLDGVGNTIDLDNSNGHGNARQLKVKFFTMIGDMAANLQAIMQRRESKSHLGARSLADKASV